MSATEEKLVHAIRAGSRRERAAILKHVRLEKARLQREGTEASEGYLFASELVRWIEGRAKRTAGVAGGLGRK